MIKNFEEHLKKNFPFLKDKKILIAISGGIDSIVLCHLLHQLKYDISLAHCNFNLRGEESDGDEKFIIELSKELGLQLFRIQFKTEKHAKENKQSIQIAARNLRYNWFKEILENHNFDYVVTGHNTNDNLETFIINLTRETGLEGLTGIPSVNGKIARPLLAFSRNDILMYAIKNNVTWREDKSNANIKYIRNKVRHKILPILEEINPNILNSFKNTLEHLNESQSFINEKVSKNAEKIVVDNESGLLKISLKKLSSIENKKTFLFQLLKKYNFTEWNDVNDLIAAQSGKQIFSKTHRLIKDRSFLILDTLKTNTEAKEYLINTTTTELIEPIHLKIKTTNELCTTNKQAICVDKDLLKYPLTVRTWKNGDYIYPIGMEGKKKLSKYFKDEKFSLLEKENTWLLCNADNEIIWVINHRQDKRFSVTKKTKNSLKIAYKS
ncbi:tRNA lysidine(34) synthetase TilS [Polaribacter sp. MSW13]|uniref:tRNA(Ile)-lysidine synthase n=1 Tax=Polaribacter marinus TaxID=2916838 RepID=A0A9X1VNB3_9FLAO|nr:tRNA lysidine(34) synthetase TilS [Polaribacter marinus]MCI2228743.1 tRNA lysidine(34) synthetase TilS [Polaribacter marinus]